MEDITYDIAGKSDISELVRLRIAYMYDDFGEVSDSDLKAMHEQLPGYFEEHLGDDLIAFVARADGRLVAAAYLLIINKPSSPFVPCGLDGEVLSVYTEDEYRRKGICSRLIGNLVEYGRARGLDRIVLMATDEGYPVYKKQGFTDKVSKYRDMIIRF